MRNSDTTTREIILSDRMSVERPTRSRVQNRGRAVVFTLNNYTDDEVNAIKDSSDIHYKWIIFGKEVGENGTPHLQGAFSVASPNPVAYSTMHSWPGMARAHYQPMWGNYQQQLDYCSKGSMPHALYNSLKKDRDRLLAHPAYGVDADVFIAGAPPEPGKSNALRLATDKLIAGSSVAELARDPEMAPVVARYPKGLTLISDSNDTPRTEPPCVLWFYGKTGTGKTRCAVEFADVLGKPYWLSSGNSSTGSCLRWFDGYSREPVVILDDFRPKGVSFNFLLRLFDRYPMRVECKLGSFQWKPTHIIITAPYHPKDIFETRNKYLPEDIAQLLRRITKVLHFGDGPGQFTRENYLNELIEEPAQEAVEEPVDELIN